MAFRRFILSLFLVLSILGSALPGRAAGEEAAAETVSQSLLVDGTAVEVTAFRIGGKVYTPLRTLAALLAGTGSRFSLTWDGAGHAVYLSSGGTAEPFTAVPSGKRAVKSDWLLYADGVPVSATGYNVDGWNCYRISDLAEAVGFTLNYSPSAGSLVILPEEEALGAKDVTLMVYMVGSDLEPYNGAGTKDMAEMAASGVDTERVNVLVYTGGATNWQSDVPRDCNALFLLTAEGFVQQRTFPLRSMGEAENLSRFVNYAHRKYPAETFCLILWDHGSGPILGCGIDRLYDGDSLTLTELDAALAATPFGGEEKLGFLGFDACLMASAELACLAAPYADYLVASQETEPSFGWDYAFLRDCGQVSSRDLAVAAADRYGEYCAAYSARKPSFRGVSTLSVTDLRLAGELEAALEALFRRAAADVETGYSRLAAARFRTHSPGRASTGSEYDLADLGDLCTQLAAVYPEEAGALEEVLERAVVHSVSDQEGCSGLSLYYPCWNKLYYQSSWQTRYRELGIFPAYQAYLEKYGAIWSGTELKSWFTQPLTPEYGEEPGTYTLTLTPEQAPLVAECRYDILERGYYTERFPDSYAIVYAGGDVSLEGNVLTARFDGSVIYCENDAGERALLTLRLLEAEEGRAEFRGTCSLILWEDRDSREEIPCEIYITADTVSREAAVRGIYAQSGEGGLQSGKRQDLDPADYDWIYFYHRAPRLLTRDGEGRLPDYWSWPYAGVFAGFELPLSEGLHFRYGPLEDPESEYFLILTITDVQGNVYSSEPLLLPGT